MIQIERILCPVDFSEFSGHALAHAAAIASWCEASLTVVYVFPNTPVMDVPPLPLEDAERQRLMARLEQFAAPLATYARLHLRVQDAPDVRGEILAQAAATSADLLVIGSHGRSGVNRFLLGSVAEKLVRQAPCPTLVVPKGAPEMSPRKPARFRRIVCAVDFSDASSCALKYAVALAEEADARLTMLHAIEVPPELGELPWPATVDIHAIRAAAEADRLGQLRALIPEEARTYCTVETEVREGPAYREILKAADERHADLIVMGVRGRGAIDLMVFGSNTARVMRQAACPVLIVRPPSA